MELIEDMSGDRLLANYDYLHNRMVLLSYEYEQADGTNEALRNRLENVSRELNMFRGELLRRLEYYDMHTKREDGDGNS